MEVQRAERAAGRRPWRIALIVLLAVGVAPLLGSAIYVGGGWLSEGGEYLADLPGLLIMTLVQAVPFLVLSACALRTKYKSGLIVVTIASLVLVATNAYGYWVVFFPGEDSSSTDALIFVLIIPVQWAVAAIAGITTSTWGKRRPVTRTAV